MNEKGPGKDIHEGDELPQESELSLEAQQKKIESTFGKSLKCFARWGVIGAALGGFFVSTKIAEQGTMDAAWRQYISSTLSPQEMQRKESNEARIRELFGKDVVAYIEIGDNDALFERQDERGKPQLKAPENQTEQPDQEWSRAKLFFNSAEEYKLCPKGWINGEVDVVRYVDEVGKLIPETMTPRRGAFRAKNRLYLYRIPPIFPYEESVRRMRFMWTIYHELGHANDWDDDMDLNVLQRQDFLLAVHDRITSSDAYSRSDSHYYHGGIQYHQRFIEKKKKGLYRAAREYWADICAGYFSDPAYFRKRFPADFDLVAAQVQINDPSFDVFDKQRIDFHHLP